MYSAKDRSIVRLGSTTSGDGLYSRIEINSVTGVRNSASKLLMKRCFNQAEVKTALWYAGIPSRESVLAWAENKYPIITKSHYGSRGVGNTKHDSRRELEAWMNNKVLNDYIFEQFVGYTREYRLHISKNGCFYACRKLLRNDAPEGTWQRHDDVVTWALESNPSFKKPNNWNLIVEDCVKAQKALGLDICAFDVMVQGSKEGRERNNPEWIIVESASAPSFGDITTQKYIEEIPKLIKDKANR
jgi:D-alanine-D-alanine ligase-like ATP-grasp enzyme